MGGSGLYIQAICQGIALLPDPDPELRKQLQQRLQTEGVESLRSMLRTVDPEYYHVVDPANGVRIQRALEVSLTAGQPYSQLVHQPRQPRPFDIETIIIERNRDQLRQRISSRVDQMLSQGLQEEARHLYPLRHLSPLNTVGYKEFFALWDTIGNTFPLDPLQLSSLADTIRLNTWHYAKKQLTWLKKYVPLFSQHQTTVIPSPEK